MPRPTAHFVKLPDGGEIVPEHYHEGDEGVRRFQEGLKTVLSVSPEELSRRQKEWEAARKRKRRRAKG